MLNCVFRAPARLQFSGGLMEPVSRRCDQVEIAIPAML